MYIHIHSQLFTLNINLYNICSYLFLIKQRLENESKIRCFLIFNLILIKKVIIRN